MHVPPTRPAPASTPPTPPTLHTPHTHVPQFPTIHDLRLLNMMCTICTMGFALTATALSIYSGGWPRGLKGGQRGRACASECVVQ